MNDNKYIYEILIIKNTSTDKGNISSRKKKSVKNIQMFIQVCRIVSVILIMDFISSLFCAWSTTYVIVFFIAAIVFSAIYTIFGGDMPIIPLNSLR